MDGWTLSPDSTPVFDRNRRLVGTLACDDGPGSHGGSLEVALTPRASRRLDTDRRAIQVPARAIEAIRRDGIRLSTTIQGLGPIPG